MKALKRIAALLLVMLLFSCSTALAWDQWAYFAHGEEKPADLFFVCPTVDMGQGGGMNMSLTDEDTIGKFIGATNMELGIYADVTRIYAPLYRQVTFPVYSLTAGEAAPYFDIAYGDVREAFLDYMTHENGGRPLVLAGFSQGADMILRLMKEFFADEDYAARLVAAYAIGWRLTEEDMALYPWLIPAEGETDTGCIVLFNTEAEGVTGSITVPAGMRSFCINPLNWRTDSEPAAAEENPGACFTDYGGVILQETPGFTGAYINPERGTLIAPDVDPGAYSLALFGEGVYHVYDYQFFYRSLQENVRRRVMTFLGL